VFFIGGHIEHVVIWLLPQVHLQSLKQQQTTSGGRIVGIVFAQPCDVYSLNTIVEGTQAREGNPWSKDFHNQFLPSWKANMTKYDETSGLKCGMRLKVEEASLETRNDY
jgi:hypothetical protein